MQQTGTLKKRRKRNLAKINGLSTAVYDENDDYFDGSDIFGVQSRHPLPLIWDISSAHGKETRVRVSGFHKSQDRVTRNPNFHAASLDDYDNDDEEKMREYSGHSKGTNRLSINPDAPYLLDKSTMNRLRVLLILGLTSGSFPWYWSKKNYRIEKFSPRFEKLWNIQWVIVSLQMIGITIFQYYSFYNQVSGTNKTFREVFMMSFSVFWYTCTVYYNINLFFYKEQMRNYINTMLNFNKEYVDKYVIDTTGYSFGGRVLINISIPSNCTQVFASVALFLRMPYQPWYLFSYIYPKPWYWLIPGAIEEYVMAGQVVTSYMLIAWVLVAHTNTVEFWLRESHKNGDSDYTIDDLRNPRKAIETYKALQVLCSCFNDCMAPLAIPMVKICSLTGLIPTGYVLIRSMNRVFVDEFPGILTYPIGVIDLTTCAYALLTIGAEMFDIAVSFVDSWSRTKHKNFRRILMSCPALKVKVGRFYFMSTSTTITFFKVTFDFITDCIITFP